jgi:RNA polymerase sigma-70 factor (ECF subfamily)
MIESTECVMLAKTWKVRRPMTHHLKCNQTDPMADILAKLQRRARRLARTRDEAEDMAQETALRLWQVMARHKDIEAPEHYAMTMLHNLARQNWRARRPTEELSDDMAQAAPLAPARIACAELMMAIERLPEDQAALMRLVMTGESSPQVLASLIGVPKGTVMSRLGRARARLREDIGLEGSVVELL